MATSYRFTRTPMWLTFHVLALAGITLFMALGFWQLRRLDERRLLDARITQRMAIPAAELAPMIASAEPDELELRHAMTSGTYAVDDEIVLRSQSLDGISGHHILTPLVMSDGRAVIVDRGWVPIDMDDPPVGAAAPPEGVVAIEGIVELTQVRGSLGPVDPPTGHLDQMSRVDLERIATQLDYPTIPVWLQLNSQTPHQEGDLPRIVPEPAPGGGPPHLSYAVQWFTFATIGAIGYPLVLRKRAMAGSPAA